MMEYCKMKVNEVLEKFSVSKDGLSKEEAERRLKIYGENSIREKKVTALEIFLSQFRNPMVYTLFGASAISFLIGDLEATIIILVIISLNSILSFFQEYRSVRAVEKLKRYITFSSRVVRDGKVETVDSRILVPGDIVLLSTGDRVPADLRIIEDDTLLIDESVLTGEHYPIRKISQELEKAEIPQEMKNIAFAGSVVKEGKGIGVVVSTGESTYFGKTAKLLTIKDKSEFQVEMENFSKVLLRVILISVFFVFIVNTLLGHGFFTSLLFAIALAVGLVPEPLPFIVTLSLSRGSLKLAEKGVIVKRLSAVEELGNVDLICCDKTGTLTENKISVRDYFDIELKRDNRIIIYSSLCNSAIIQRGKIYGNPIDVAILEYANKQNIKHEFEKVKEIPFDYERKRMSVIVDSKKEGRLMITKGSPESILEVCSHILINGRKIRINKKYKEEIAEKYKELSERGLRTIAIAIKKIKKKRDYEKEDEKDLSFLGFIALEDPPKKTVKETLDLAKKFGIQIKIITGDGPIVSKAITKEINFEIKDDEIITGKDLDQLLGEYEKGDEEKKKKVAERIEKIVIFARTTPEQKYKIIKILKTKHVVAYLGDGVNDAPSLIEADVGISVNEGTDVAKESADIILTKKSLKYIVDGIIYGRSVFSNIVKYIKCTFAGNFGNLYTVAISSIFLKFVPLLPTQILLINFLTDAPLLTISTDRVDEEELLRPKKWEVVNLTKLGAFLGMISTVFDLILIYFIINLDEPLFRSVFFLELIFSGVFVILSLRTNKFFLKSTPSILPIVAIIFVSVVGVFAIFPPVSDIFQFKTPTLDLILLALEVSVGYLIVTEIAKIMIVHRERIELSKREIKFIEKIG